MTNLEILLLEVLQDRGQSLFVGSSCFWVLKLSGHSENSRWVNSRTTKLLQRVWRLQKDARAFRNRDDQVPEVDTESNIIFTLLTSEANVAKKELDLLLPPPIRESFEAMAYVFKTRDACYLYELVLLPFTPWTSVQFRITKFRAPTESWAWRVKWKYVLELTGREGVSEVTGKATRILTFIIVPPVF